MHLPQYLVHGIYLRLRRCRCLCDRRLRHRLRGYVLRCRSRLLRHRLRLRHLLFLPGAVAQQQTHPWHLGQLRQLQQCAQALLLHLGDVLQLLLQLIVRVLHGDQIRRHCEHGQYPQHQGEHLVPLRQKHQQHQSQRHRQQHPHTDAYPPPVVPVQGADLLQQAVIQLLIVPFFCHRSTPPFTAAPSPPASPP